MEKGRLRVGQIGIGHNHAEMKMVTAKLLPELFEIVGVAEEDEAWPEFVQPTHAGTAYQVGDKVTFQGERYICVLAHCVWSPADYPAGWEKQA